MGLFSRKRDAQGLYTGDAPVSAPGVDGAAPGAYQGVMWGADSEGSFQTPPGPGSPSYSAGPSMPLSTDPPTPPGMTPFSTGPVRQPEPAPQAAPGAGGLDPASIAEIQQVLGHGLAAKLSARLGEGLLNGLLTARLGLAAVEVTRPLPFAALPRPVLSDLARDLLKRTGGDDREDPGGARRGPPEASWRIARPHHPRCHPGPGGIRGV